MHIESKNYFWLAATFFSIIAILHFIRLTYGWPAEIGGVFIPPTASWLALFITVVLAIAGFKHAQKK